MLSLPGLGLSLLSLWFLAGPMGRRTHTTQTRTVVSLDLLPPGLVPHPLYQCLTRFLCVLGCCADEAAWRLALPLQRTLAPFWCPCCVFWRTQHDYTQTTDRDRQLAAGPSSCLPPTGLGHCGTAEQSGCLPSHQSFLAPALQRCVAKAGAGSHSPSPPRDLCPVP